MNTSSLWTAFATMLLPLAVAAQQPAQSSKPAAPAVPVEVDVSMCSGCHSIPGYRTAFPRVHRVPMISGQSARYLVLSMQQYRRGERSHPTMRAIARALDDAQIEALAAYYAGRGAEAPQ